jgi:hypothetical protein
LLAASAAFRFPPEAADTGPQETARNGPFGSARGRSIAARSRHPKRGVSGKHWLELLKRMGNAQTPKRDQRSAKSTPEFSS